MVLLKNLFSQNFLFCFLISTSFLLTGCQIPYLVKSAYNHLSLISKSEDIEVVLKKNQLDEKQKQKLQLAQKARIFAEKELGLKKTDNYTEFVQLERDYVSYILSVSPAFQLKTHTWWFPIVGDVPYKGFKTPEEAKEEAKKFDSKKYDTYIRGASAYSTLGWFDDPILSSMLRYRDYNLVNLIIHETVHATIYIKSQADFNEQLATFIGNIGTEAYYQKTEGENSETLKKIKKDNHDARLFSKFITEEIKSLKTWYETEKKIDAAKKQTRLKEIQNKFKNKVLPKMKTSNYKYFLKSNINNAQLLGLKTYIYDLSQFEKAFNKLDRNFNKFLDFAKKLEDKDDPEKELASFASAKD